METVEQFKIQLTCQICKEPLFNPAILDPCGHVFCEYCVIGLYPDNCHAWSIQSCPMCRTSVKQVIFGKFLFLNQLSEIVFGEEYKKRQ